MNKACEEWLSKLSMEMYGAFCKIDSIQDRVRNLTPLYVALGTGYAVLGAHFPHYYTDGNLGYFYLPFSIGVVLLIASISILLYVLFWLADLSVLGNPTEYLEICKKIPEEHDHEETKIHLDRQLTERRCDAAAQNFILFSHRSKLINVASRIGVVSFVMLMASSPRFISCKSYELRHPQSSAQPYVQK